MSVVVPWARGGGRVAGERGAEQAITSVNTTSVPPRVPSTSTVAATPLPRVIGKLPEARSVPDHAPAVLSSVSRPPATAAVMNKKTLEPLYAEISVNVHTEPRGSVTARPSSGLVGRPN